MHPRRPHRGGEPVPRHPSRRRFASRAGADGLRSFAQIGLCGAEFRCFAARRDERARGAPEAAIGPPRRCARWWCESPRGPRVFVREPIKHGVFFNAMVEARACEASVAVVIAASRRHVGRRDAAGCREENRRGLLTVEKTVISFRRKQTLSCRASDRNQRDNVQHNPDLRPHDQDGGRRRRIPRENVPHRFFPSPRRQAQRAFSCPRPGRGACRIRPGAPCAPAVDRGSDSRGVASNWAVVPIVH